MLTLLDDTDLREVIIKYLGTVEAILKVETKIQQVPMAQQLKEMYTAAFDTAKTDEERQKLQDTKKLLFG